MGAAARTSLPRSLTRAAIKLYSSYFDVALDDVDPALRESGFESFDAFFTRPLKDGARPVADEPGTMVSPSDGALRECRKIVRDGVAEFRAKGHAFTLGELLADHELAALFEGGTATTIYLHPRDYHRVHTAYEGQASALTCVPGRLLPVTDAAVARDARLFSRNERVVHMVDTPDGPLAIVMVAAFGVGHMSCTHTEIPAHPQEVKSVPVRSGVALERGQEIGMFHLGSTVIVVAPRGFELLPRWRAALDAGEMPALRMGEALLRKETA
jgi:phosphatidylserine decarboxylase